MTMVGGGPQWPVACYRLPALLSLGNGTLLAFASARNWTGDGCHPLVRVHNPHRLPRPCL